MTDPGRVLKSFDARPLWKRGKAVVPLIAASMILLIGGAAIFTRQSSSELLTQVVTWIGLLGVTGAGAIGIDDARTKPILAQALGKFVEQTGDLPRPQGG